jgi:hypothetical protein
MKSHPKALPPVLPFMILLLLASSAGAEGPKRAILFIIDGLHWQAPERLALPHVGELVEKGVWVEKSWLIMPHHPVTGEWARLHNSSIPNPVMLAGTLFIEPEHRLIQEVFPRAMISAHAAGSSSYHSVNRGSTVSIVRDLPDAEVVDHAIAFMRDHDVRYLRVHLQRTGSAGMQCFRTEEDVPWRKHIWGEGSPYIQAVLEADKQLGRFVAALKELGKWDDTFFILTSDHGQADFGWHPLLPLESWLCPMVFVGPGIAKGQQLDYAEAIDIIPTVCEFLNLEIPNQNGATGHSLAATLRDPANAPVRTHYIREINEVLREYYLLRAEVTLRAHTQDPGLENTLLLVTRNVYDMDRFADWHRAGSLETLLRINREAVTALKAALERSYQDVP